MLSDRLEAMEVASKQKDIIIQRSDRISISQNMPSKQKVKKQASIKKSNIPELGLIDATTMLEQLEHFIHKTASVIQADLACLFEEYLILEEDCVPLKKANKSIAQQLAKCEEVLKGKASFFYNQIKIAEQFIADLEKSINDLNIKYESYINQLSYLVKYNEESVNIAPNFDDKWYDCIRGVCNDIIPLTALTWAVERDFVKLRLDDSCFLSNDVQKRKSSLLNSDVMSKINNIRRVFPGWFNIAIIGGSLDAIKILHQLSPATLNLQCRDIAQGYNNVFHHIILLSQQPLETLSQQTQGRLNNYILIADFLYENVSQYRDFFLQHTTSLLPTDIADIDSGLLVIALKNHHLDLFKMFLRHGLSIDSIQLRYKTKTFNLQEYLQASKLSLTLEEQRYLSLLKLDLSANNPLRVRQFSAGLTSIISTLLWSPVFWGVVSYFIDRCFPSGQTTVPREPVARSGLII